MVQKVQYSPEPEIIPYFRENPFAYSLDAHDGVVITTINRVRVFLDEVFGLSDASKKLITAVLAEISGRILGEAVDTYGNISQVCILHVWSFRRRVEIALKNGEIQRGKRGGTRESSSSRDSVRAPSALL